MQNPARVEIAGINKCAGFAAVCAALLLALAACSHEQASGTPQEMIVKAWASFRIQDFDVAKINLQGALDALDKLKAEGQAPPDERQMRTNALYGLGLVGTVGRIGGGSPEGRTYLQRVIDEDPNSPMAAWAALALVRDQHLPQSSSDPIDIPELRKGYAALIKKYPGSLAADEAFLYLQSLYIETLVPDDSTLAITAIKTFLVDHPSAPFRSALYTLMNQAHVILKDYPAALQDAIHALQTKEIDPTNPNIDNTMDYYRIGLMAEYDVGDFATAREYFGKFLKEYGTDQKAFNVKLELARMDKVEKDLRAGKDPFPAATAPASPLGPSIPAGGGKS